MESEDNVNYGQIESLARIRLGDSNAVMWSRSILLSYANRTIEEVTRESEGNIKHVIFPLVSGQRSYQLPSDCFELRDLRINGKKIFGKQAYELEDLDQTYLTATGTPEYYYQEDSKTVCFYKVPSWTSSYFGSFTSELGEVDYELDGTTYSPFQSNLGIITDVVSDTDSYFVDSMCGLTASIDITGLVCEISYVYQPAYLINDSDIPDLPIPYQWILVYGMLDKAFRRGGQGKNERLAAKYGGRRVELEQEFFARQKEMAHGRDQIVGMIQMSYGAERDYSMRVWR